MQLKGDGLDLFRHFSAIQRLRWFYLFRMLVEASRALNGVGEPVEQGFGFLESEAGIGDALTVCDGGVLTAGDQVALDHQRSNRRSSQVLHDRVGHVDLSGGVLAAVTVAAVNHEDLGKMRRAKQSQLQLR